MRAVLVFIGYALFCLGVADFLIFVLNSQIKPQYMVIHIIISMSLIFLGSIRIIGRKEKK